MSNTDRRRFISSLATAGLALPLYGLTLKDFFLRSGLTGKIHIFSKSLTWLSYDEMADLIASTGAGGIDLTVRPGGNVLPENAERDLPLAVKAARKKGLEVEMIVTSILRANEQYAETIVRTAASLGVKFYRMGWLNYDEKLGIAGTIEEYRKDLFFLERLNRKYNIHGAYQNHAGTMAGSSVWDIYEMLKDFDPQYIGCQYDVRHAVVEGFNSWPNGLKLMAPWIKCTDIKDFRWRTENGKTEAESVPLGEGVVDFKTYFTLVQQLGLNGPVSVHFEYPPVEGTIKPLPMNEKVKIFRTTMKKDIDWLRMSVSQ